MSRAPRSAARPYSRRALPPGPAHMSSQRSGAVAPDPAAGAVSGARARAIAASWLPSSWTAAAPDCGQRSRVAGREGEGVRGPAAGLGVGRHDVLAGRARRERGQGDPGAGVAGLQRAGELAGGGRVLRGRVPGGLAERVAVGGDDPARMAVADRQVAVRVGRRVRGDERQPGVQVAGGDAAQHRVDVAGNPRARPPTLARSTEVATAAWAPTRVLQQLVGAEAQHVEDRRVELVQRAVAARGEHRVVGALAAQGAVGQLGRERGVAAGESRGRRAAWAAAGWRRPRGRGPRRGRRRRCGAGRRRGDLARPGAPRRRPGPQCARRLGPAGWPCRASPRAGLLRRACFGRRGGGIGRYRGRPGRARAAVTAHVRRPSRGATARRPRAQSAAGMRRLPCGWTSPRRTGTCRCPRRRRCGRRAARRGPGPGPPDASPAPAAR